MKFVRMKNKKGKVKNFFSDMYLINLLLAHARTRGIPEKNHEHTRALC